MKKNIINNLNKTKKLNTACFTRRGNKNGAPKPTDVIVQIKGQTKKGSE